MNYRSIAILALLAYGLATMGGCQSSVRVTPGAIKGTHEHTVTTIGAEPAPLPPLHIRLQENPK